MALQLDLILCTTIMLLSQNIYSKLMITNTNYTCEYFLGFFVKV